MEIREVNHGIANNFGDHIEINKHLKNYPHLYSKILEHEFAHTNKAVSIEDFKLDLLLPSALHQKELFKFMIKHPKSFTQLLPFYWSKTKGLVYDINMIIMYSFMFLIIFTTIYFGLKFL